MLATRTSANAKSIPSPAEFLNQHTQSAFDATPSGLVIVDHNRKIAWANRAAIALFHWNPAEVRGESAEFLLGKMPQPDPTPGRVSALLHLPLDETWHASGEVLQRTDGSEFPAQVDVTPFETTEGMWYVATIGDQTEQKRLESTVHASRQQLHDFFEAAPQAVITLEAEGDATGHIVSANVNAARLFGYDAADMIGLNFALLSPLPAVGVTQELTAKKKDGSDFPVEITSASLPLHEGSRNVALITDLTDRKKLERSLEEATQRALALMGGAASPAARAQPTDPLEHLASRQFLEQFLSSVAAAPAGWHAIVFTVRHLKTLSDRLGKGIADRLLVFASHYIKQSLTEPTDNLFHWQGGTMVATVRREAVAIVRQEASDICGRRLEHMLERGSGGGSAMVLVSLASSTFSLEGMTSQQMVQRIQAAVNQATR